MTSAGDRNAPLSPISVGGSEWSFSKYTPNDDGSHPNSNRGNLVSPPNSGGSPRNMSVNGLPSGPRSTGGPSPPPSVGRSSNGTNLYVRSEDGPNGTRTELDDAVLIEHYYALRAFLMARDPNIKQQPNKARDKLLRLSPVQFFELSTDVFDELMRRQATARTPPNAPNTPPTYLLPEKTFHPKRNQARQRLSSLGPPRFRDLAADVFHELERRFPHFVAADIPRVGSSMSMRGGPMIRTGAGTPVTGNFPPRGQSRMRRPSDASSIRGPPPTDAYGIPPSPSLPNGDYGRPMPRQPNQNNTIVPNKSTMLEEDDDGGDTFGLEETTNNRQNGSGVTSDTDKKLIEDYQKQVQELREKLDGMEGAMKKKEDEMSNMLNGERSRATAATAEKEEWADIRANLEDKLAEAQNLNNSLKEELERMREDHERETSQLRNQAQQSARQIPSGDANEELQHENEQLRHSLQQQQQITEEARKEAQESLREMRMLSQQSGSKYEKQAELEKTIEKLEREVREWRNRYARAKTQIRSMRASSIGLTMDEDAAKYVRDKGYVEESGLVKDVHVTKFQMAIDELLQKARQESPDNVIDAMKSVVVSVRRITRDLDESTPHGNELVQQQGKLKAKVSATANSLITASKNFAASAGLSPVSLIDAAASHLTVAIVDLLRAVKIRPTPTGELEEEDDGTVTPIDSTGFFSPRSTTRESTTQDGLPPPPAFQAPRAIRASVESSAYSPVSSPRASVDAYAKGTTNGYGMQHDDGRLKDLKIYLGDQVALLVADIQSLVNCVRSDANIGQISTEVESISAKVGKIMSETQRGGHGGMAVRLGDCRDRLLEAKQHGQEMASSGVDTGDDDWRTWTQTLPPIAFEIFREAKEHVERIGTPATSPDADEFL